MKRMRVWGLLLAGLLTVQVARAEETARPADDAEAKKVQAVEADGEAKADPNDAKPAEKKTYSSLREKKQAEAAECFQKLQAAYMNNKWDELKDLFRSSGRYLRLMDRDQQKLVLYMRKSVREFRPRWWKNTKSASNVSFRAGIWRRNFMANYMPSDMLGAQAPVGIRDGKILVIVSWRPTMVDNPEPAGGALAKMHGVTKGDLGEVIVWHELGHNYITNFLPLKHVIILYNDHNILFHHLQEFYADMTSLYHCSPKARLTILMFRLNNLDSGDETCAHARMSYGIGSLLLSEWMQNPDDWPSVHFPAEVPENDVEKSTIMYVYENFDPNWTVKEDKALREMTLDFIRRRGESVLRSKGVVPLHNGLEFNLIESQDREAKVKRDKWVAQKLKALIKAGRADEPIKKEKNDKGEIVIRRGNVEVRHRIGEDRPRIHIPW